jgi:hypothetical protein
MIDLGLDDLVLYQVLQERGDKVSVTLTGLCVPITGDARAHLEFVRTQFPGYTDHSLQHSLRIIDKVGRILEKDAQKNLSSAELFILLLAALFHDVGMVADTKMDSVEVRREHARRSGEFIRRYLKERLTIVSEHHHRLGAQLSFIVEAHSLTWDEMVARQEFQRPETVMNQLVRSDILAILLRVGDLLDLDSERSPHSLQLCTPGFFLDEKSLLHHHRHQHVTSFRADTKEIRVDVESHSKEEHQLWNEWFVYLRQDILQANTYVFVGNLEKFRLPPPRLDVKRAPDARYEMWPLRFEIDEAGKIWDIISKSIYTGQFDFVRELLQNALDAELMWIFAHPRAQVFHPSPRSWRLDGYAPMVGVLFSASQRSFRVIDNGIGMDKHALESFLFRVAETGYEKMKTSRPFRFPSIAKFGIGFVSVLVRASRVVIDTAQRLLEAPGHGQGRRVLILGGSRDAYVEYLDRSEAGTSVLLELRADFTPTELEHYITTTFVYPSAPLLLCDLDALEEILKKVEATDTQPPAELLSLRAGRDVDLLRVLDAAARFEAPVEAGKALRESVGTQSGDNPARYLGGAIVHIRSRPLARHEQHPVVFRLAQNFEIAEISTLREEKISRRMSFILWVPMALDDPSRGIEWRSMHGFLVHQGSLRHDIFQRESGKSAVQQEANEAAAEFYGDDEDELFDDSQEHYEELWLDGSDKEAGSALADDHSVIRISHSIESFHLANNEMEDEYQSNLMDPMGLHLADLTDDKGEQEDEVLNTQYFEVLGLYDYLSNEVFQDGIRIPVRAASIAPIGVCRARVNLTAEARFMLNASRNAIDESPALLEQWVSGAGAYIQQHILERLVQVFAKAGISWDQKHFFLPEEISGNPLLAQSLRKAREILRSYAKVSSVTR